MLLLIKKFSAKSKILKNIFSFLAHFYQKLFLSKLNKFIPIFNEHYSNIDMLNRWFFPEIKPNFFNQKLNLSGWMKNSNNVHFAVTPSLARMYLKKGNNVLDIGCGEGTISKLFFSDIAGNIDAFDVSEAAIKVAKESYGNINNINFINSSPLDYKFKDNTYDIIFWCDAVDYFTNSEIKRLISLFQKILKPNGHIIVKTPLTTNKPALTNNAQKSYQDDLENFTLLFEKYFEVVISNLTEYNHRSDLDIVLKKSVF